MASPMSKRSCPVRQLSLQQDLHGNKFRRNPTLTKQKSCDSSGTGGLNNNHLKLQINSTKFGRSLTPDVRPPRRRVPPPAKHKAVKLAWSDKNSISVSSGGEGEVDSEKVQVIAKKCKEIQRPFTAKPKIEVDTKNTILYTKEELADRLKSAIKERQSRKQNLDIFLAHNVNNQPEVDHRRPTTNSLFQSDLSSIVQGTAVEVSHSKVLGFQNMPTSFVPYDDFTKVGNRSFSTATKVTSSDAVDPVVPSKTNLCNTCIQNCDADNLVQKSESAEESSSYFLMASSPCLHGKEEHEPRNILKFKEIFNIEKQRPFSVRVIDDRIDIFNDGEGNDSLLIESDNEEGDFLSSSVEIEGPSRVSIVSAQAASQNREDVCPVETKLPSKVPASERRNMFKNSGGRHRNSNMNATSKPLDSVVAKRSRLVRMSSAPSANVNKPLLKKQTTIGNDSQDSVEKVKSDEKQDLVIPTINVTDENETDLSKFVENKRENETIQNSRSASSMKETNNKYSKLVLRKQNSMIHFSAESDSGKSLEKDVQPLHESMKDRDNIQHESQKYSVDRAKSPIDGAQRGTERIDMSGDKPDSRTLPLLDNKFTIQRQNSKPNKISFQSTLTNYMKNETNMIKPILTNSNDGEKPDRVKSAMLMANKKKLKFAKKKFHKSLDDVSHEGAADAKKLTRIPNGRDVVTMVSLLSDESDAECDTPEPCSMMVQHPSTLAISPQPVEDSRGRRPVSTFQVCLRRPGDKPVALPVQTSASGRSYATLYPSRRGPGFDASASSTNSMASFTSASSPLVSAAFKRKQTRVKSASLCSSSKSTSETDRISIDDRTTTHSDTVDHSNEMPSATPHDQDVVSSHTPDVWAPSEMTNINLVINLTHPENDEEIEHAANQNETSDQRNQNETSDQLIQNQASDQLNQTVHSVDGEAFGGNMDLDKPPIFSTSKERDCWAVYQKMMKKGINVSYDTILRGILTPTEYRLYRKCNAAALERADSLSDNIAVN